MLSSDFKIVEDWFFENYMILNLGKYYFMCIRKNVSDSELLKGCVRYIFTSLFCMSKREDF